MLINDFRLHQFRKFAVDSLEVLCCVLKMTKSSVEFHCFSPNVSLTDTLNLFLPRKTPAVSF